MNKEKMLKIAKSLTWLLCILWVVSVGLLFAMVFTELTEVNIKKAHNINSIVLYINNILPLAMLGLLLVHLVFRKWLYFFILLIFLSGSMFVSYIIYYTGCCEAGINTDVFIVYDYPVEKNVGEKLENEEKQVETIKQEDECFTKTDDFTTIDLEELRRKGCFGDTEKPVESETIEQKGLNDE